VSSRALKQSINAAQHVILENHSTETPTPEPPPWAPVKQHTAKGKNPKPIDRSLFSLPKFISARHAAEKPSRQHGPRDNHFPSEWMNFGRCVRCRFATYPMGQVGGRARRRRRKSTPPAARLTRVDGLLLQRRR
jgi:hypothetical protein